jgi:hypothetical protein
MDYSVTDTGRNKISLFQNKKECTTEDSSACVVLSKENTFLVT